MDTKLRFKTHNVHWARGQRYVGDESIAKKYEMWTRNLLRESKIEFEQQASLVYMTGLMLPRDASVNTDIEVTSSFPNINLRLKFQAFLLTLKRLVSPRLYPNLSRHASSFPNRFSIYTVAPQNPCHCF
jgi:hypothetical protein